MKTLILCMIGLIGFQFSNGQPCTAIISSNGPTTLCKDENVVLTANAGNANKDSWLKMTDFGGEPRSYAVGFSIGTKGYIGTGYLDTQEDSKDFWAYDPVNNTWTQIADFEGAARSDAIGFSIEGKGYTGLGFEYSGGINNLLSDFWEYDPVANNWTEKTPFGGGGRLDAIGFSTGGKGYVGLGYDNQILKNDFWEYDPANDKWTQKNDFSGGARSGAVSFSSGNKGYVGTGRNNDDFLKDFWEYDPPNDNWTRKADFGGTKRFNAAGFSIGDKGYIGTGSNDEGLKSDFWEYDASVNSWTPMSNYGGGERWLATSFSIGEYGYIGIGESNGYVNDIWQYHPNDPTPENIAYLWTTGETTKSITVSAAGSYSVTVTDNSGCAATASVNVASGTPPAFVSVTASVNPVYTNTTTNMKVNCLSGSNVLVQWYKETANSAILLGNGVESPPVGAGTYYAVISGDCSSPVESAKINISLVAYPNVGLASVTATPNPICSGKFATLTATGVQGANAVVTWWSMPGGKGQNFGTGNTICGMGAGTYYARVEGDVGMPEEASVTVVEYSKPTITTSGPTTFCDGAQVVLKANTGDMWMPVADFPGGKRKYAAGFSTGYKGYIIGGEQQETYDHITDVYCKNDFWEYDPRTNTWKGTDFPGGGRESAIAIGNGKNGYLGMGNACWENVNDFWEFDPNAGFKQKAAFAGGETSGATGFSIGDKIYMGTGYDNVSGNFETDFWEYDPASNSWTQKANFSGPARAYAVGLSIAGKGYIGLGSADIDNSTKIYYKDCWEYNPQNNEWNRKADFEGNSGHSAFSIGSKGYVCGGQEFWEFDPSQNSWTRRADFLGGPGAVGFSIEDFGYLGTGEGVPFGRNDFWKYIPPNSYTGEINYLWSTGETTQTIVASKSGSYSVTVTDNSGCSNSSAETIVTIDSLTPPIISPGGTITFCEGESVKLSADNVDDDLTYLWSTGESTPTIMVTSNGTYTLTIKNNIGCTATSESVEVAQTIKPSFTVKVLDAGCSSSDGSIIILATGGNGTYQYSIDNGASFISNNFFSGLPAATYPVVVKSNGCVSITQNKIVNSQVKLLVSCPGNIVVSPSTLSGTIVNYTMPVVTNGCPPVSLDQISGLPGGAVFPIGTTTNIFKAVDGAGNTSVCSFTIVVTSPYSSGLNKVYICHKGETISVDVKAVKAHLGHGDYLGGCPVNYSKIFPQRVPTGIEVFPNPSKGKFTLRLNNIVAQKAVITIFDSRGSIVEKRILNETLYPATLQFDLGSRAHGNYMIKVETSQEAYSLKVVIQ